MLLYMILLKDLFLTQLKGVRQIVYNTSKKTAVHKIMDLKKIEINGQMLISVDMEEKKARTSYIIKNQWLKNLKKMPEEQHKQKSVRIVLFEVSFRPID